MANLSFIGTEKLSRLLVKLDPGQTMKCTISDNRLAIGTDPFNPAWLVDFSTESVKEIQATTHSVGAQPAEAILPFSRRSGTYSLEVKGRSYSTGSLKQLLREALLAIEIASPGTLEKLSQIKPYSKRIVARDPKLLFEAAHLSDEFSEKLTEGWWFGTNNSAQEVRAWLERATSCAGLRWGVDVKLKK